MRCHTHTRHTSYVYGTVSSTADANHGNIMSDPITDTRIPYLFVLDGGAPANPLVLGL